MDAHSLNATLLLEALGDLSEQLHAIWRYLRPHPEVVHVVYDWCLAHTTTPTGQPKNPYIEPCVDAELRNGRAVNCTVHLDWWGLRWRLHYYVRVNRADRQEEIINFPVVETDRLEEIV